MNPTSIQKTLIASSVALTLGAANAQASLVINIYGPYNFAADSANFTMLSGGGGVVGGTNDVVMNWDGNAYTASSDYTGPGGASNVSMSSTTTFFGYRWTAHDIQMFMPGSYSFDTSLGGGNPESGILDVTVPSGDMGMHLLWDWNGNLGINIDVFVVAAPNSVFGTGLLYRTQTNSRVQFKCDFNFTGTITKNCLYDGPNYGSAGAPTKNQTWILASVDGNGDGVSGIPMAAGSPFAGLNANFNANLNPTPCLLTGCSVPVPAAVWLFGSGLIGLFGVAKRRKQ